MKERVIRKEFTCVDCKGFNDDYMIRNEVWSTIAPVKCLLCLTCVQARLKRPLTRHSDSF